MKSANKNFIYALSIITGTIVGVGFFSLPFIASKVGFLVMLVYFLILGILIILTHLFFTELSLKTPDFKRLPGFAKFYLGSWGEKVASISFTVGLFGTLLAYLIVGGEFLGNLLSPIFGGGAVVYTIVYFSLGAILIFLGMKTIAKVELYGLLAFFLIAVAIFIRSKSFIKIDNLFPSPDLNYLFLPYGPILFSLWGADLIPEIEEMMGNRKDLLKKIIPLAILIAIIIYSFFIYLILGISGTQTTESGLIGLKNFLPSGTMRLAFLIGVLATFTSFLTLGLTLKKVFWYDLKIGKNLAWLVTCSVPLMLFFIGFKNFIPIISFVGGIALGINAILILLMYRKINPKSFLVYPLLLIFLGGIIYEIMYFLR